MKYYIVAGEASGDLHASNLMKAIKRKDPEADFRCWGGDLMEQQGGEIIKHYRDLAFMGFFEVFTHLRTVLNNLAVCKVDILLYEPDVLILVDFPGFNLRIAEFAKENGIKVAYYISPQIWAWKKNRIHKIKACVDAMMVILPFEEAFYAQYDYPVHYVGHPLLDAIPKEEDAEEQSRRFREENHLDERPIIALLPGSRKQEIKAMLPRMIRMQERFPDYQFIVSTVSWIPRSFYDKLIGKQQIATVLSQTYPLLYNATAALVTSGTATLETALFKVPQVVCYRGNWISYFIAKHLIKGIHYISLVNLISDAPVVTELIQADFNDQRTANELDALLHDPATQQRISQGYEDMIQKLGHSGASDRAADVVLNLINRSDS